MTSSLVSAIFLLFCRLMLYRVIIILRIKNIVARALYHIFLYISGFEYEIGI